MKCPKCGKINPDYQKFCRRCHAVFASKTETKFMETIEKWLEFLEVTGAFRYARDTAILAGLLGFIEGLLILFPVIDMSFVFNTPFFGEILKQFQMVAVLFLPAVYGAAGFGLGLAFAVGLYKPHKKKKP